MTTFEVGKIYKGTLFGFLKYKCLAVVDGYPVMVAVLSDERATPFVSTIPDHEWKEYVEPKPPIIVERWVNYYIRKDNTVSAQLFKSRFDADRDFMERAASYQRNPLTCVKPLRTTYIKERFDAV